MNKIDATTTRPEGSPAAACYALRENRRKRRNLIIWQLARLRRLKATKVPTEQQLARIDQLKQDTGSGFYGLSLYA
jgi:hypothetical protein